MTKFQRKDGEKATLLSQCGMSLFGCTGETMVTQGIYIQKSWSSEPLRCFCKRGVWVPTAPSQEHFMHCLDSCGVTLPFSVPRISSLRRFGLCGINPTRTVHASDTQFFLLAKFPCKQFTVYGIVTIKRVDLNHPVTIVGITMEKNFILQCVGWIKSEADTYHQVKEQKRSGRTLEVPEQANQPEETVEQWVSSPESLPVYENPQVPPVSEIPQPYFDTDSDASYPSECSETSPAEPQFEVIQPCQQVNQINSGMCIFPPEFLEPQVILTDPATIQQPYPTHVMYNIPPLPPPPVVAEMEYLNPTNADGFPN